jgi:multiple sugar transport system ATP-binding protein
MIAGLEEITSGKLMIDGEVVNDVPPDKRGLAMVFPTYALYPHRTVAENMAFSLRLVGVSKAKRYERGREIPHVLQQEPLLNRKPKELSGGQRQQVAICRVLVRNPKVFLYCFRLHGNDKVKVNNSTYPSGPHSPTDHGPSRTV